MKLMNTKEAAEFFTHRSPTIKSLIIVALFLCAQTGLRAQSVNATLTGTATDQTGAILPGVTVRITNPETGLQREVETSDDGTFILPALPPATYTVSASKDGFAPVKFNNLTLNVNDQRSLRIELRVGDVNASVSVNVDETSLIDNSPAQTTTIDRQFVENLPLNGRSFQSLILLSPGVVAAQAVDGLNEGQFSVNGQRTNANYFTVDGVSANVASNISSNNTLVGQALSGSLPGLSALGTTNTLVPVDALEEFKIQTSTYSAEFGRQPGGQVQIVTRSGKSDFHGSIFDYVRNEVFDANNFFINAKGIKKPPLRQNQFGGTFSGPVFLPRFGEGGPMFYNGKKRTFFFFAYEGTRLRLPVSTTFNVPSLRLRQIAAPVFKPILNAYPIPTGAELTNAAGAPLGYAPFQASYSNPSSSDSYGIRIDHNLTNRMTVFGRYNEAPSSSLTRLLSLLEGGSGNLRTLTLGTTLAGKSFSNELRFNYTQNRGKRSSTMDDFGGGVPIDQSALIGDYSGSGVVSGTFQLAFIPNSPSLLLGDQQDSFNRQINIVDNVSIVAGNHQLKFGIDYRRLMPTYAPITFARGATLLSAAEIPTGIPFLQTISSRRTVEPRFTNYSFFAQDTWKVNQRLTLDLGLRYELNPTPTEANGLVPVVFTGINGRDVRGAVLAPPGTPFFKAFKTAFAPRLGAVYQLSKTAGRETVLRGGFGVFYDLNGSQALSGFAGPPFRPNRNFLSQPFLFTPTPAQLPVFVDPPRLPINSTLFGSDPDLKLPYTLQYNFGIEQSLGKDQAISISYVGSKGRQLLSSLSLNPRNPTTGQFANPNFQSLQYTINGPSSDYDSLQAQFTRRLTRGLQALVNYTWSHAIDEGSDEFTGDLVRGSASFDVRHNFSAALTYEIPNFSKNRFARAILGGWAIDSTVYLQSGQPIDILLGGAIPTEDGRNVPIRPDLVPGVPFWIEQAGVPGGRRINPAAFALPPQAGNATSPFVRQGTLGRNVVTAPPIYQVNMGLRREFKLTEQLRFQFRAESFNLFNRPQFAGFSTNLFSPATFGIPIATRNTSLGGLNALYQIGGPRSFQFSGKLFF